MDNEQIQRIEIKTNSNGYLAFNNGSAAITFQKNNVPCELNAIANPITAAFNIALLEYEEYQTEVEKLIKYQQWQQTNISNERIKEIAVKRFAYGTNPN